MTRARARLARAALLVLVLVALVAAPYYLSPGDEYVESTTTKRATRSMITIPASYGASRKRGERQAKNPRFPWKRSSCARN